MADFNFSFMGMDAKEQEMRLTRFERDLMGEKIFAAWKGKLKLFRRYCVSLS